MVATLLIVLSMLASVAALGIGLTAALVPAGSVAGGLGIVVLALLLGAACVQLAREEWGLLRRRHASPTVAGPPAERPASNRVRPAVRPKKHAAPTQRPARPQRRRTRARRETPAASESPRENPGA